MGDEQSIQFLSFNFVAATFAYSRIVQGLIRSLSTFDSVVGDHHYLLVKIYGCGYYKDNLDIAAQTAEELLTNTEFVFLLLNIAIFKLSMKKCTSSQGKIDYSCKLMRKRGKKLVFFGNLKFPALVKPLPWFTGFINFYRQYLFGVAKQLIPLYQSVQTDIKFHLGQGHKDAIFDNNENLARAAKLTLRLPLPDQ